MAVDETSRSSGKSSASGTTGSNRHQSPRCSRRTELQALNRPLALVYIARAATNSIAHFALQGAGIKFSVGSSVAVGGNVNIKASTVGASNPTAGNDSDITVAALGTATAGAGALAVGVTMPAAASWCLSNPVACNRVVIAGGEIAAGDALGPTGLAIGSVGAAAMGLKGIKSAEEANAIMKAASKEAAWSPGTAVISAELKPGTKVQMVITEGQYLDYMKPALPGQNVKLPIGNWATFDDVAAQVQARQNLAITSGFKSDVKYVIEYEVVKPVDANIGFVGAQTTSTGGTLRGGGTQMEFDWSKVGNRADYLRIVGQPKALPVLP